MDELPDISDEAEQDAFAGRGCFAFTVFVFAAGLVTLFLACCGVWMLLRFAAEFGL